MGLMDKIDTMLGGEERTFDYQCTNCEAEFESPNADMSKVNCPECGSTRTTGVVTR